MPNDYRFALMPTQMVSLADRDWWEVFKDPELQALIDEAMTNNLDLMIASARVKRAQDLIGVARSPIFPQVNANFSTTPQPQNSGMNLSSTFQGDVSVGWELDVWGKIRRSTEAARAEWMAAEYFRKGLVSTLVAQVASSWFELQSLAERIDISKRTIKSLQASVVLEKKLKDGGVASLAEVRQAEGQLATTEASLPVFQRQEAQQQNALSVVLGRAPGAVTIGEIKPFATNIIEVPAGLPSDLLNRRPDILKAEQDLVAANANVGVAKAAFFPVIGLTADFGALSTSLQQILSLRKEQTLSSLGPYASLPLFVGGKNVYNYKAAKARAEEAALAYRQTILLALQEVADALVGLQKSAETVSIEADRARITKDVLDLTTKRYLSGVVSYIEILDAQRQLFSAEIDLSVSNLDLKKSYVQLYKALGGGWKVESMKLAGGVSK